MVIKTIAIKLARPSAKKRGMIDRAIAGYSAAFEYLLERMRDRWPEVEKETKSGAPMRTHRIMNLVDREVSRELNRFQVQPFKDALKMDYAMAMTSFSLIREATPGARYPIVSLDEENFERHMQDILSRFDAGSVSKKEFAREVDRYIEKYRVEKPLLFCRYAVNRDYCLLYNEYTGRFYAKLYLMSVDDTHRERAAHEGYGNLRYITREERYLEPDTRPRRYIVLPLSIGEWQRGYLCQAIKDPSMLKTARLVRRRGDYYLLVNIACATKPPRHTYTTLGIARAVSCRLHYTVSDREGQRSVFGTLGDSSGDALSDGALHALANQIVTLAGRYNAQVITCSLVGRSDRLYWSEYRDTGLHPLMSCAEYNRLCAILAYKLPLAGLPRPVTVSPNGIFYSCPNCHKNSRKNRFSGNLFICTVCGKGYDIEELGSYNLSTRLLNYRRSPIVFTVRRSGGCVLIENADLGAAFRLPAEDPPIEQFFDELYRALRTSGAISFEGLSARQYKKRLSLVKKLSEYENLADVIRFREIE